MTHRLTYCAIALLLTACGDSTSTSVDPAATDPFVAGVQKAMDGDAEGAMADLRDAAEAAPHNVRPLLWITLLGGDAQRLESFRDRAGFEGVLARWALGEIERDVLLVKAGEIEDDSMRDARRAQARFYLALAAELAGTPEDGRGDYEACVHVGATTIPEHRWAAARLEKLGAE